MTTTETPLNIGPVRPSFKAADAPPLPTEPFGPDFTQTPDKDKIPPKVNQKNPPRAVKDTFKPLGQNKKLRSPVRKLTREPLNGETKSDFERLVDWYLRISKLSMLFLPKFAMAMEQQAEDCADAWFDLAENNDTVRRYILAMIEGGAWTKVIAAHTPIFLAVIPEETLNRFFLKVMGTIGKNVQMSEEDAGKMMGGMFGA